MYIYEDLSRHEKITGANSLLAKEFKQLKLKIHYMEFDNEFCFYSSTDFHLMVVGFVEVELNNRLLKIAHLKLQYVVVIITHTHQVSIYHL